MSLTDEQLAWKRVGFSRLGDESPAALVAFDRQVAPHVLDAVLLTRWGAFYVASLSNDAVCWFWCESEGQWHDLSGGMWVDSHYFQWRKIMDSAREVQGSAA